MKCGGQKHTNTKVETEEEELTLVCDKWKQGGSERVVFLVQEYSQRT